MSNEELSLPDLIRMFLCESLSRNDIRELLGESVEWSKWLKESQISGTAPLLYYILKTIRADDLLPPQIMLQLEMSYYVSFTQNTSYYRELNSILNSFRYSGIQALVLKGAVLAEILYPDMSLRPFSDVDLLIRKRDLARAENDLLTMGYMNTVKERRQGHGKEFEDHFSYLKHGTAALHIELHTCLFPSTGSQGSVVEGLWDRSVTVQIGGISGFTLSSEDTVLHLCTHIFGHGSPLRLLWLCDLALIISKHGENLNWKLMEKRSRNLGIHRIVCFVLEQMRQVFDIPLPRGAFFWLGTCELSRMEEFIFTNKSGRVIWHYLLRLRSLRVLKDKLRFMMGYAFPCRDYIMWRYSIPDSKLVLLGYCYRFYHFCLHLLEMFRTISTPTFRGRPFGKST